MVDGVGPCVGTRRPRSKLHTEEASRHGSDLATFDKVYGEKSNEASCGRLDGAAEIEALAER